MQNDYPAKERYKNARVASQYDAQRFESPIGRMVDWLEKRALRRILKFVNPGSTVLDLPAGTGRITEFLLRNGYRVAGVDISEEMLNVARLRCENYPSLVSLSCHDAEKLPFPDAHFDYTVSVRLLGHVPKEARKRILSEMARVSRRGVILAWYLSHPLTDISKCIQSGGKRSFPNLYPVRRSVMVDELRDCGLHLETSVSMLRYISECTFVFCTRRQAGTL